ncbi:MAG TPA: glycosyltransferase, partial [Anaerolineae bacterium]
MRILHVIPYFTPEMGGSARVAYQMAYHLGRRGHQVTVLTSDYGMRHSRFAPGPFEIACLSTTIARWGFYVNPALPGWAASHTTQFDLIHMHTVRTYQNAVLARHAAAGRVPFIISAHGTLPVIMQRQAAKRAYDLIAGRSLLAAASRMVAVSTAEAEQYRAAGIDARRIRIVPNGLDLDEFANLPAPGSFRRRFASLPPQARLLLYLGRLHRIKGVDRLIEAFARLARQDGSVLIVVGPDDGDLANLRAVAARLGVGDCVWFAGPLYGRDRLAALVDADVVAAPSRYEIFGLVPFEALMCGTPVIVADDCGSGELIGEAGAGEVVSAGDIAGLAAALQRTSKARPGAMQKVASGQAFVRAHLDWNTVIAGLEDVYREIC